MTTQIFNCGKHSPTQIVFSYPLEEDKIVPVEEALDWVDEQDLLWHPTKVVWEDGVTSFAKGWWFSDGKIESIGAGAYGDYIVCRRCH